MSSNIPFKSTVKPPNSEQVGTRPFVHYLEVVLYSGVLCQEPSGVLAAIMRSGKAGYRAATTPR